MTVDEKTFEHNFIKTKAVEGIEDTIPGFVYLNKALRDIGIVLVNIRDALMKIAQNTEQMQNR